MKKTVLVLLLTSYSCIVSMQEVAYPAEMSEVRQKTQLFCQRLLESPSTESPVIYFGAARLDSNQHVFLMGESHSLNRTHKKGSARNYHAVRTCMELAEKVPTDHPLIHVLVEHFSPVDHPERKPPATISHGLLPHYLSSTYKNSLVENCENRRGSCLVSTLLELEPTEESYAKYDTPQVKEAIKQNYGFDPDTMRWEDLLTDFARQVQESKDYQNNWRAYREIHAQFDLLLHHAEEAFQEVRDFIGNKVYLALIEEQPEPKTIYEYVRTYGSPALKEQLLPLSKKIIHAFSYFVDIYAFHRLLQLRQQGHTPIIIVYAGAEHARNISRAMTQAHMVRHRAPNDPLHERHLAYIAELIPHLHEQMAQIPTAFPVENNARGRRHQQYLPRRYEQVEHNPSTFAEEYNIDQQKPYMLVLKGGSSTLVLGFFLYILLKSSSKNQEGAPQKSQITESLATTTP